MPTEPEVIVRVFGPEVRTASLNIIKPMATWSSETTQAIAGIGTS
jgi:hypothetical protein